jgi:predicted RNase H-like nuclease
VRVIGVDGCRGGWVAATVDGSGNVWWQWTASIVDVLRQDADVVAIDIPIGLPDAGRRACDVAARALPGVRGGCVFPAPVRAVLACRTYAEAREVLAARGGASMSAQAFGIVRAVGDVDAALTPADQDRVVEAHPEVAFARMNAGTALPPKRTAAGAAERTRLVQSWMPEALRELAKVPARVRPDDALDALACAWVAGRFASGEADVLGDGERDPRGLVMRIVV